MGAKGRLYSACVHSTALYESKTSPVKEDVNRLERNYARMIKWIWNVRPEDTISAEELRT